MLFFFAMYTFSTKFDFYFQLFELLGIDRFELIQSLIQNRQKIIKSAFLAEETAKSSEYYKMM